MGGLQQDQVGPAHQVKDLKQCQVRGGATHLPSLLTGDTLTEDLIFFYQGVH